MRYLKTYKLFESQNLDSLANQFLDEYSNQYDLRLGKSFDKEKANCSWFTKEFYNWVKSKSIDVKIVYFDSDVEAHIVPMIDGQTIDFSVKQFTKNSDDDYLILKPEDYIKWGYSEYEVLDEFPDWATVRTADVLNESRFLDFRKTLDTLKDLCLEFEDNECPTEIWPKDDIKLNLVSLKSRELIAFDTPFYLEIDINRRIIQHDDKRSGFGPLPEWFIDNCRVIEQLMESEGFKTLPSVRYGTDWENFDTIDELAEQEGLFYKVRLEFQPSK